MDFLKAILGDELYGQFEEKINAHNGNEANKDNQIKLGNLGGGEYVSKGKYDGLQALFDGQKTELDSANALIAELKKNTKGNEDLQGKISGYETQVTELQKQLAETKINAAVKVALLVEKALDVDYLTFKINEKMKEQGKALELDENENIKGWEELRNDLKTQFPAQFEAAAGGRKILGDNRLPECDNRNKSIAKEDFAKMGYNDRLKLKQENEQLFRQLAANN